jgi:type I restriction enzyme, R subunit
MLAESGVGGSADIERAKEESHGLGLFVRSLVGMDREAAKAALADFLGDRTLGANQIEFVNLIVDHLTERGVLLPAALYESPFTDLAPTGPDAIFAFDEVGKLICVLESVTNSAAAA